MRALSFSEAVQKLSKFNIRRQQIYLIDLVLLAEMAWADGRVQSAEKEILFDYLKRHVDSINRLAGCTVLVYSDAMDFVDSLLEERPDRELLQTIHHVTSAIRLDNKSHDTAERARLDILNACLDIAASSVTKYPYGLTERFTAEEKEYYHKMVKLLTGTRTER